MKIKKKYTITICTIILTTILLYLNKIESSDWIDLVKWLIGFMTVGFVGKRITEKFNDKEN